MLPYSFIGSGSYVNAATPVAQNIALSDRPDWFFVKSQTDWGLVNTADAAIYGEWTSYMPAGSYRGLGQSSASPVSSIALYPTRGTSGGFTFIDQSNPPTFTSLASTGINDSTFVVLMANTGSIAVGDRVRVINPVGMEQIGGLVFQVTAVTVNTSITLGYMATAVSAGLAIAANATAASILKISRNGFYPKKKTVLFVTQATQAKVYFAEQNDFTPGEIVDFTIPSPYGMTQLSYRTRLPGAAARVLSVINSATESSIVIDVDTTGFTAFVYPASSLSFLSPATCYPAGSGIVPLSGSATIPLSPPGTNLVDAFDNKSQFYMNVGLSVVGAASATMEWFAFKSDYNSALSNA